MTHLVIIGGCDADISVALRPFSFRHVFSLTCWSVYVIIPTYRKSTICWNEDEMSDLSAQLQDFFYGLASENRQKIFFQVFLDGQEHTVSQVAQLTRLGQSTVSEHLAILKRAGILLSRRAGKEVYYRPDREHLQAVLAQLTDFLTHCCQE